MTISQTAASVVKNYKYSENAFLPKIVTVPLAQEINCNCKCLVHPGDYVKEGDIIAEPEDGEDSKYLTKIHSPIPGKIIDVVSVLTPNGSYEKSVRIRLEGKFSYTGQNLEKTKNTSLIFSKEQIMEKIAEKGIVNTFITQKPISLAKQISDISKKNDLKNKGNLIVRLFDEDSVRVSDSLLTKFHAQEIIEGARITARAIGLDTNILFVADVKSDFAKQYKNRQNEKNKHDEKKNKLNPNTDTTDSTDSTEENPNHSSDWKNDSKIENTLENINPFDDSINFDNKNETYLFVNIKKYPSGFKPEIINSFYRAYKKNPPFVISGNDLFADAYSMYEVYNAIVLGKPVISRWVNFSGNCIPASCFLNVKIGYSLRDILEQLGDFVHQPYLVVINGMMCGDTVSKLSVPITKSVKSVEFLSKSKFTDFQIYNCINCGNCRSICQIHIAPDILYNSLFNHKQITENQKQAALACNECGLCNTVCPARLPICQTIAFLKTEAFSKTERNENEE